MKMKTFSWVLGLVAGVAFIPFAGASVNASSPSLKIGDPAPAIEAMAWIKGEPVKKFEPGRVYVVEFWATWCGPCNMIMPHLSELQKKHADNLTIIGVNVRESDKGKAELGPVSEFVKKKGDKMAYTVAMDDPNQKTVFDTYMTAGGSYGIPTSFIVGRDGKLAWVGYPTETEGYTFDAALTDALAGKSDLAKARELQVKVNAETTKRLRDMELLKSIREARSQKDFKRVVTETDKVVAQHPDYAAELYWGKFGAMMHVDEAEAMKFATAKSKDTAFLKALETGNEVEYWGRIGATIAREKELSKSAYQQAAGFLQKAAAAKPDSYDNWLALAGLQHDLGNMDQAIAAQERAVTAASTSGIPADYLASLKKTLENYKSKNGKG